MKSEYHKPVLLPGEKAKPSIKVDADKLLGLLLRAEPMMNATDRRRYADHAIIAIQDVIKSFTKAHDFPDDRLTHLKEMWGDIAVFVITMRHIGDANAICIQPKHEKMTPDDMKRELSNAIASLEEGADAWRKSVIRTERMKRYTQEQGHDRQQMAGTGSSLRNKGDSTSGDPGS